MKEFPEQGEKPTLAVHPLAAFFIRESYARNQDR